MSYDSSPFRQAIREVAMHELDLAGGDTHAQNMPGAGQAKFDAYLAPYFDDTEELADIVDHLTSHLLGFMTEWSPTIRARLVADENFMGFVRGVGFQLLCASSKAHEILQRRNAPLTIPDTPEDRS
jgi:hypothetical protein